MTNPPGNQPAWTLLTGNERRKAWAQFCIEEFDRDWRPRMERTAELRQAGRVKPAESEGEGE
jgi:hypothetical protein